MKYSKEAVVVVLLSVLCAQCAGLPTGPNDCSSRSFADGYYIVVTTLIGFKLAYTLARYACNLAAAELQPNDFNKCNRICPKWTFGYNCSHSCLCKKWNSFKCGHVNGRCECRHGWRGAFCTDSCPQGLFGPNCEFNCKCLNGGLCDRYTGNCRCPVCFVGENCQETATISTGSKEEQSKTNESTRRWAGVGSVILVMLTIILVLVIRRKKGSCTISLNEQQNTLSPDQKYANQCYLTSDKARLDDE
ncbi:multiple epidermal growth factor-like domains protein 10 [Corticium candelabrum]|uniref:multiple epidermal growth factor-like domains protein 10 n=1 Tax=Corticium candelabrum TaxID=121492 RepID=UPI002E26B1AB|nr:multiple epidermal growth factor-like domains protein 10 [Corticium candelabrum]